MTKELKFMTPEFSWVEAEIKGQKKCFVEGYISTIDPDDYNEIVTMKGQNKILSSCKGHVITMDVEHEEFIEGNKVLAKPKNTRIPVAKIIEATMKDKGVWVKAEINQDSDRFKNVWGSIKNGFLHSFSIAFAPVKAITKSVNGVAHKFIDDLNLINVTLTGSPVNTNATFIPVMKAAIKSMGENTMVEENNETVATEEATPVVETAEPVTEEVTEEKVITANDLVDAATKLANEQKEFNDKVTEWDKTHKVVEPVTEAVVENNVTTEPVVSPMAQIKSKDLEIKKLKEENIVLKARLSTPILKSRIESRVDMMKKAEINKENVKSPLEFI